MHSRVFVLATKEEILSGDYQIPDSEDVLSAIRYADYVGDISTGEKIKEDIDWFKVIYGQKTINGKVVFTPGGGDRVVGYKINVEAFKKALEKIFDEVLEKVREDLEKSKNASGLDKSLIIDSIHYTTECGGFYFFTSDNSIINETFLYYILERDWKDKDVYIIATIDYHM